MLGSDRQSESNHIYTEWLLSVAKQLKVKHTRLTLTVKPINRVNSNGEPILTKAKLPTITVNITSKPGVTLQIYIIQ